MSTILFDFDGTLADTFPLVVDITYDITRARRLRPEKIEALRKVPLLQAVRSLGGKPWDIPFLILLTRRAMTARMEEVPAFHGVVAAVEQLHRAGHDLYVLSSNREQNVRIFLERHRLDTYFSEVYHCNVFRKGKAIMRICESRRLAKSDTFYIGNEAADIEAVRGTKIQAVAVTWGGQDEASLAGAEPFALVRKPAELVTLFTEVRS